MQMNKRFTTFIIAIACIYIHVIAQNSEYIFVSPIGREVNDGSKNNPFGDIVSALNKAKKSKKKNITIYLREGKYYLSNTLEIKSLDFKDKRIAISAYPLESVTISGGKLLSTEWKKYKKDIWVSSVDEKLFDQLYINGKKCILARYPNYTPNVIFNGTAEDALSSSKIKKWKNPSRGYIHAMHSGQWGDMHYEIINKRGNELIYKGGFQNNRPSDLHKKYRFVENIFEELDGKEEWFYNKELRKLYYIPLENEELKNSKVEISYLSELIKLVGDEDSPLRNITISNIRFENTRRTFMESYEQLMRSDWCIHRGAAIFLENTENCIIKNCEFTNLGGNALFISKYNFNDTILSNHFYHIGASAICVVGDTSSVRSGLLNYNQSMSYEQIDKTPGPANMMYPRECLIEDNLIHNIGQVEKQVAGVQIQIAAQISVRHNSIYQVPRAGINIGDGAFGGNIIEWNDVFDTVLETSDHGAFNSWGRDRFWNPERGTMDELVKQCPYLISLDARYTNIIRNNRFKCNHGWDIDLDDGSSNYHIYNNVCLQGGIKLREGFYRTVENNIIINNSFHPHVWFEQSGDRFERNIVMQKYYPIALNGWGKSVDYNFFTTTEDLKQAQTNHTDLHSISGTIHFTDALKGDYSITRECKAFSIGFENFPMKRFGVYSTQLKEKAEKPSFPILTTDYNTSLAKEINWLDGKVRLVEGMGDRSAYGLPDEKGIIITHVENKGILFQAGIQKGDVIRSINEEEITSFNTLISSTRKNQWTGKLQIIIFRNQKEKTVEITLRKS